MTCHQVRSSIKRITIIKCNHTSFLSVNSNNVRHHIGINITICCIDTILTLSHSTLTDLYACSILFPSNKRHILHIPVILNSRCCSNRIETILVTTRLRRAQGTIGTMIILRIDRHKLIRGITICCRGDCIQRVYYKSGR